MTLAHTLAIRPRDRRDLAVARTVSPPHPGHAKRLALISLACCASLSFAATAADGTQPSPPARVGECQAATLGTFAGGLVGGLIGRRVDDKGAVGAVAGSALGAAIGHAIGRSIDRANPACGAPSAPPSPSTPPAPPPAATTIRI